MYLSLDIIPLLHHLSLILFHSNTSSLLPFSKIFKCRIILKNKITFNVLHVLIILNKMFITLVQILHALVLEMKLLLALQKFNEQLKKIMNIHLFSMSYEPCLFELRTKILSKLATVYSFVELKHLKDVLSMNHQC